MRRLVSFTTALVCLASTAHAQFSGGTPGASPSYVASSIASETTRAQTQESLLLPKAATIAGLTVGNNPSAAALAAQVAPQLPMASTSAPGLFQFPGGTTNFIRADGTAAAPPGGVPVSTSVAGLVPALPNTGTKFFRDDGTYATPPGSAQFTSSAPGVVPAYGAAASTSVLSAAGTWVSQAGGGNVSTDTAGTIGAQAVRSTNGMVALTLQQRASMTLTPLEFGAQGNGSTNTIGTTYGSNLLAVCGYTTPNTSLHPFQYLCTDPQMGLEFSLPTSAAQSGTGTTLIFISPNTSGGFGWNAHYALFDDPGYQYAVLTPSMVVSGPGIPANTTLVSVPQIPQRTQRAVPANATDWTPNTSVASGRTMMFNYGLWQATAAGTTGAGNPYSAGAGGSTPTNTLPATVTVSPCTYGNASTYNNFHPGGNDPGVWVASYAGTTCNGVDGSVSWTLLGPIGYAPVDLGTVVLSQATTTAVPAASAISFAVGSSTIQGLTQDTLGWMGALSNGAHASPGGCSGVDIDMRAGDYAINYPLFNEAEYGNIHCTTPSISITARGAQTARLTAYFDPGFGHCVLSESSVYNVSPITGTRYSGFDISGTVVSQSGGFWGVDSANTGRGMGLCVGESAVLDHIEAQGFYAGVGIVDDHQSFNNVNIHDNEYGVLFRPYSPVLGNQSFRDSGLAGNVMAGIGIAASNQFDAGQMSNVHTGFGTYGFYALPAPPNVTSNGSGVLSNLTLRDVWIEDLFQWIDGGNRGVGKDTFSGGGYDDFGRADKLPSNYQGGTIPVVGLITAADFSDNTLIGTSWSNFGVLSTASSSNILGVINLTAYGNNGTCARNKLDDVGLITLGTSTQLAMACNHGAGTNGGTDSNTFNTAVGSGVFKLSNNNNGYVAQNYPVWEWGQYAQLYQDGQPFGGIAAAPQPTVNNWSVPVYTQANFIYPVPKANINIDIPNGASVYPTSAMGSGATASAGVGGSVDQDGAIGVSINDCSAGLTVCGISLNPLASAGNGSYAANLTASGQTLGAKMNTLTTVASGASVILPPNVPIGAKGCVRINNYGANALTLGVPSGWTLSNGASAATTIGVNSGAQHCRNGPASYD